MNIAGKRIIITGGSSGIGFAMAKLLGAKGARLLLTGRPAELLATVASELKAAGVRPRRAISWPETGARSRGTES